MFSLSVLTIFEIARRASVVESPFVKVIEEFSAFYNSVENSVWWIGMILKISRNFLKTKDASLQPTGQVATLLKRTPNQIS